MLTSILLFPTALYDDLTVPTTTNLYISCISPKVKERAGFDWLSTDWIDIFSIFRLHLSSDEWGDALQRVRQVRTLGQREDHVAPDRRGALQDVQQSLCGFHDAERRREGHGCTRRYSWRLSDNHSSIAPPAVWLPPPTVIVGWCFVL